LIRIGSAGWSYPDWDGIVYPPRRSRGFDALTFLASYLDCVEINSSFYRIPDPGIVASWAERTARFERFVFSAKLWRGFTHAPEALAAAGEGAAESAFKASMRPLREAGKLGPVLIQFPYSTHNTPASRSRLREILDRFGEFSLVVEFRHASWMTEDLLGFLRERGAAFCNIDQPAISSNVPPTAHATGTTAYVRLHGRNSEAWFEEGAGRDRRYDYLYSAEELDAWAGRIRALAARAKDVIVIANNHYRGQGVANALELRSILEGTKVQAPRGILDAYPRMRGRAEAGEAPGSSTPPPIQGILPFR
jgi:uncharacterized protein YecE (DUF72 family)